MTERHPDAASAGDANAAVGDEGPPGTPRWVKIFGVLTAIVALVFVMLLLAGGHRGAGRHFQSRTPGSQTPPPTDAR